MNRTEREEFDAHGIVRLPRAVDPTIAHTLRRDTLALLETRKLVPADADPSFAVTPSKTAAIPNAHRFDEIWSPRVRDAIDVILGANAWNVPKHAGQLLAITFPHPDEQEPWLLPHKIWHLDYRAPGSTPAIPGLQIFLCVDDVAPRGGGTLVAAGTPRLIDAIRERKGHDWDGSSANVRNALIHEVPWIRALSTLRPDEDRRARFMHATATHDGVELQVVELSGNAGDVYVMHPWMLHAPAPNRGDRPRLVLTERIRRRWPAPRESANVAECTPR